MQHIAIGWELRSASENDIPIVGVVPFGQERISTIVQKYAVDIVRWNTESIVRAIREYAL